MPSIRGISFPNGVVSAFPPDADRKALPPAVASTQAQGDGTYTAIVPLSGTYLVRHVSGSMVTWAYEDAQPNGSEEVALFSGGLLIGGHFSASGRGPRVTTASSRVSVNLLPGSNDIRGALSITMPPGASKGPAVNLTFAIAFSSAPFVLLSSNDGAVPAIQPYASGSSPTGFSIGFGVVPLPGTYTVTYMVIG